MTFILIFVLVFLGVAGLLTLSIYGIGLAIKRQANKKVKSFFAPIPRPGSFSFIALEGKVVDVIDNVVGWELEGTGEDKLFQPETNKKGGGFWEKTLGVI